MAAPCIEKLLGSGSFKHMCVDRENAASIHDHCENDDHGSANLYGLMDRRIIGLKIVSATCLRDLDIKQICRHSPKNMNAIDPSQHHRLRKSMRIPVNNQPVHARLVGLQQRNNRSAHRPRLFGGEPSATVRSSLHAAFS